MKTDAAADTTLLDTAADTYPAAAASGDVGDALASNVLAALVPRPSIVWDYAVARAVTALGAIVKHYIDVMAVRIRPTYAAVVHALWTWGLGDKVPEFQAAWEELRATPDGRAVVAVCKAAAAGGALLGRLYLTEVAEEPDLEDKLHTHYRGAAFLPVLLAAARYYHIHAARPATLAAPPEWPSLDSLLLFRESQIDESSVSHKWLLAVAPAITVLERIVDPLFDVKAVWFPPTYDGVVTTFQNAECDDLVPLFDAKWATLCSTPEGRAVIAVCAAAGRSGAMLGWHDMPHVADVPDLVEQLTELYAGEEFLPALLAAARYYLDSTAGAAAAGVGDAVVADAAGDAGSCK